MYSKYALLAATAMIGFASSAMAADDTVKSESNIKYKDNGGYESESSSKSKVNGSVTKRESKVDVEVDDEGNVDRKVKREAVNDPEGLGNKKKTTTSSEYEEKDDGGYDSKVETKTHNAEGTDTKTKEKVSVDVDDEGNVEEKTTSKTVVDPKGLLNREAETSVTKKVNGKIVKQDRDY